MAGPSGSTVAENIRSVFDKMTRSERQLASHLLDNYPVAGMVSITEFAKTGGVSTPTVMRALAKLGFSSYPVFQEALRAELQQQLSNPIEKHQRWSSSAPAEHMLNRYADTVIDNLRQTLRYLDHNSFDQIVALLAQPEARIHIVGGRITHSLADFLFTHLQVIRPDVQLVPLSSALWPHQLLNMSAGDLLIVFDVRRYENDLLLFAEQAKQQGADIVLFTDQWVSPIAKHALHSLNARIEAPSGWDSAVVSLVILEALIAALEQALWDSTHQRMAKLESLLDATRQFRKAPQ